MMIIQHLQTFFKAHNLVAPNTTTAEQQRSKDVLTLMRYELMNRQESGELLKGPKIHHQRQSIPFEDHIKVEELTQGSTENHDLMPNCSVINITALQIQGDLMAMNNTDDSMNTCNHDQLLKTLVLNCHNNREVFPSQTLKVQENLSFIEVFGIVSYGESFFGGSTVSSISGHAYCIAKKKKTIQCHLSLYAS